MRRLARDPNLWTLWFLVGVYLGGAVIDYTIERVEKRYGLTPATPEPAPAEGDEDS